MFKYIVFFALLAIAFAVPAPEPKAAPKPGLIAAGYSSPILSAPLGVAPLTYSAPLSYSGYYAPSVYSSGYGYSPYSQYII